MAPSVSKACVSFGAENKRLSPAEGLECKITRLVLRVPWKGSGLLGPAAAAFGVGLGELSAEQQD